MMKRNLCFLIVLIVSEVQILFAQLAGDYRSIGNGNWNDPTKWEVFNGSSWMNAATYPGQNSQAATVTVTNETQIILTATVPYPLTALNVSAGAYCNCSDDNYSSTAPHGVLTFSSENVISLTVSAGITINGELVIADQIGAKSHTIFIGGSLTIGNDWYTSSFIYDEFFGYYYYEYYYYQTPTIFQTIDQDDKLNVTFNTTDPNNIIGGLSSITIPFQDVTFNGTGIGLVTGIEINGTATFTNGIVRSHNLCSSGYACDASPSSYCPPPISDCGSILFKNAAIAAGASVNSFVDGRVWKQGDDPFTFPIGDEGVYSPLTISAPANPTDVFSARYARSCGDPALWGITDPGLYSVSNCEYWELNYSYDYYNNYNYTGYLNVTVGWTSASGCGSSPYINDISDVTLAHFNGKSWDTHGGSANGNSTTGTVTWNGVNNFGSFTLGNISTTCIPPSNLTTTNITTNSATLSWSPVPDVVSYDVDYISGNSYSPYYSWINVATATTLTTLNLSGLKPLVTYYWRVRAHCISASASAYRVAQFTTQNPCSTPSGLSATEITATSALLSWTPVPNAANYTVQYKKSTESSWTIGNSIYTATPSVYLGGLDASTGYDWRVVALCYTDPYTGWGSNEGTASFITAHVTVCSDNYEPNDLVGEAKTINLSLSVTGTISSATDVDWFKVSTPGNSSGELKVSIGNLPADYDLYVYNKNLVLVGSSTTNTNETVTFNVRGRNTFYIKVAGKNGAYSITQCYNLIAYLFSTETRPVSNILEQSTEITEATGNQSLYPNPASEFVFLRFNSKIEEASEVQILNSIGQLVKLYSINIAKGYNKIRIPVNDIKPGMYLLRISKGELNMTRKLMITR